MFGWISNVLEIKPKITDYGQNTRYWGSEISLIWTLYANISCMLTNPITLKTLNRDSDFGSEDDYRTPPAHIRLWPILGIFGHISHIRSFEVWARAKEYFGAQYFQNPSFTKKIFFIIHFIFSKKFHFSGKWTDSPEWKNPSHLMGCDHLCEPERKK